MNAAEQYHLGNSLLKQGKFVEAIEAYQRAIQLEPNYADAHGNLGVAFQYSGQIDKAISSYRRTIQLRPRFAEARNNLGNALTLLGKTDEAIESYRRAIQLKPDFASAHNNLGTALKDRGELEEAIASVRRAIELWPDNAGIHSNLLYMLNFLPNVSPADLLSEHRQWSHRRSDPLKSQWRQHDNQPDPNRRIRVGYASPDFRAHPVGRFILPLLVNHDRRQFEIYYYSWVRVPDKLTSRIQQFAGVWRNIYALSDDQAAELIRRDGIDILVDLTMHMDDNRLSLFARKAAPIQMTYLAYAGTTGLDAIDYRITDPHLDPPGNFEEPYAEKSVRLPQSYWCYKPTIWDAPLSAPPSARNGFVTFGCLNNFCKINSAVWESWTKLLRIVPDSHLMMHARIGNHRDRVRQRFAESGINADRIHFVARLPMADYMRQYNEIDIALDTFPYVGGTTTCDALWMGVPVVTLHGQTAISRGGVSILRNIGLPELIAETAESYVQIAADLANDPPRLSQLRGTIRSQMNHSPLMDAKRFAADMEAAYRQVWRTWCFERASHTATP